MSQPKVQSTEVDGGLGVLPPSSGRLLVVIGPSSMGPFDLPSTFGRVTDLTAMFGVGEGVEALARHIQLTGNPGVFIRSNTTTAAITGAVALTGTGTSVPSADGGNSPLDSYEVFIQVVNGGTIGVAGITYQTSVDGGRTLSPVLALGVANMITIAGTGVLIDFAAGTLVAGDIIRATTIGPSYNAADIASAMLALIASSITWGIVEFASPLTPTLFDQVETSFAGLPTAGKFRAWVGSTRIPTDGESEAAYLASLSGAFGTRSTVVGELCAGAAWITSSVSSRKYRRPIAHAIGSKEASVSEEIDIAQVDAPGGALVGVAIRDDNGFTVPTLHDETVSPGLDDARFTVLRTWDDFQGTFVNRPRIFSPAGSDFELMTLRRVMNLARAATRRFLIKELSKPILVDPSTGFILETQALELEAGGRDAMQAVLGGTPKASGWSFVIGRMDNLLSTKTMTVTDRVIPLAYVETIEESSGFTNPALTVQRA